MPENKTRNTANVTNLMWHHKYSLKQDMSKIIPCFYFAGLMPLRQKKSES